MSQPSLIPAPSPHQEHAVRVELTMTGFADRRLNRLGYACDTCVELRAGIEPALSPWQGNVIPLDQRSVRNFEFRIANCESKPRNPQSAIRNSSWCWRKESNLHQTGFEPVASAGWATPAHRKFRIANFKFRIDSEIRNPKSAILSGTGGGSRTLIDWFLRPVPLPGWATPVNSRIEDRRSRMASSILNSQSSIFYLLSSFLSGGGRSRTCTGFTRRLSTPLPYH